MFDARKSFTPILPFQIVYPSFDNVPSLSMKSTSLHAYSPYLNTPPHHIVGVLHQLINI